MIAIEAPCDPKPLRIVANYVANYFKQFCKKLLLRARVHKCVTLTHYILLLLLPYITSSLPVLKKILLV